MAPSTKHLYTITVTVMQTGRTGSEISIHTVQATGLGRAEAQAKRAALAGRKAPYYAYAHLSRHQGVQS